MPRKILIKENQFMDLLRKFLGVKAKGKEAQFIQKIRQKDPDLADAWSKWNDAADSALMAARNRFKQRGMEDKVKEIDDLIKKYS